MSSSINFKLVNDNLTEFASKEMQEYLWANQHGNDGKLMSSFVEAWEQLFDDSGLGTALEANAESLNPAATPLLNELRAKLKSVNEDRSAQEIIDDPLMNEVRLIAAKLLLAGVERQS